MNAVVLQDKVCSATRTRSTRTQPPLPLCHVCAGRSSSKDSCRFKGFRTLQKRSDGNQVIGFLQAGSEQRLSYQRVLYPATTEHLEVELKGALAPWVGAMLADMESHENLPGLIRKCPEEGSRVVCDSCNTSIMSSAFMCGICGYEICTSCRTWDGLAKIPCVSQTSRHEFLPLCRTKEGQVKAMLDSVRLVLDSHQERKPIGTNATDPLRVRAQRDRVAPSVQPGKEALFQSLWSLNIPVVVPNATDGMQCSWIPRDFVDTHGHVRVKMIKVVDPSPVEVSVTVREFFELFSQDNTERPFAIKVKDWPPSLSFESHSKRHFDAFMDVVPFPSYTRYNGFRNLAAHWPDSPHNVPSLKPDLGPKMYIATRDPDERGSTPLHLDATSAVNILVYSSAGDPQAPGALWHIFRPEDSDLIRGYLREKGLYGKDEDPIHARKTYLTLSMRLELAERDVHAFEIRQQLGDAIFIPAGCAHQVSNLHSCMKVACDFLCTEGIALSCAMTEEFRHASMPDILQLQSMLWHSWVSLGSQRTHPTSRPLTRIQAKRKRSRETPAAQEDADRRKKHKTRGHDGVPVPPFHVYQCPHPACDRQGRTFTQAHGVFSHLYSVHRVFVIPASRPSFERLSVDAFREHYVKALAEGRARVSSGPHTTS